MVAMPTGSRTTQYTTHARPSISPLATTSKNAKSSPIATRDSAMHDADAQLNSEFDFAVDASAGERVGVHDDRSSSLSDPEDENDDGNEQNGTEDDTGEADGLVAQRSLEVDSEAETERLDQTPQKQPRKHADSFGRTPSKLSQAATAEGELSDPPSPLPTGAGAASSTSTVATAGQKRKRSDTAESSLTSADSDLGESPRKRSHDMNVETEDAIEGVEPSTETAERAEDTPVLDETPEPRAMPTKGWKGRKGKHKGKRQKEPAGELEIPAIEEPTEVEEEQKEQKEQDPAKTEEDLQHKTEASGIYEDVAKQFRAFRERLTNERLATITSELQLLSESNCVHPEYLRQVACVDARLQKQTVEAHAYYNYKMRSIKERTLAERSQLHSQYCQQVRELREDVLHNLGEDWHGIQKERRQSHEGKDDSYLYKFPIDRNAQIKQQRKYNQEVSVLSGVAKYVGFPAAPELTGPEGGSFEDDLKAMKRVQQPAAGHNAYLPGPGELSTFSQKERLAHEQFIEQNAWARPQAPIHTHGTPGISHTPDWAEPGHSGNTARNLIRNLSGQIRQTSSPFGTPALQTRALGELMSSADAPSSVLAAPPTTDRIALLNQQGTSSSPLTSLALPKARENGTRELTGFRNISGTSTISEIPPDHQSNREPNRPELVSMQSAQHQVFDTSQLHRPDERREVYPGSSRLSRVQEGPFGTPAPLPAANTGAG